MQRRRGDKMVGKCFKRSVAVVSGLLLVFRLLSSYSPRRGSNTTELLSEVSNSLAIAITIYCHILGYVLATVAYF